MAKLTFDIPDDKVGIIVHGWCVRYGYETHIENPILDENGDPAFEIIANPESKIDFTKRMMKQVLKVEAIRGLRQEHEATMTAAVDVDRSDINSIEIT